VQVYTTLHFCRCCILPGGGEEEEGIIGMPVGRLVGPEPTQVRDQSISIIQRKLNKEMTENRIRKREKTREMNKGRKKGRERRKKKKREYSFHRRRSPRHPDNPLAWG
jgi:hypothetical protein